MSDSKFYICDVFYFLSHYYGLSDIFCQNKANGHCYWYKVVRFGYIQLKRVEDEQSLALIYSSMQAIPRFFLHKESLELHIEPCSSAEQKELLEQYMSFYQEVIRKQTGQFITQVQGKRIPSTMTRIYEIYWGKLN